MALSNSSTCRACLRRLAQPFSIGNTMRSTAAIAMSMLNHQSRAKSTTRQAQDQGVVVRLLRDIPKFGREHAIFRVERGRMRNEWYPSKKAEYMTAQRFKELGLTKKDIGERDRGFLPITELDVAEKESTVPEPAIPAFKAPTVDPEVFRDLVATAIPETLTYFRKPIPVAPLPPTTKISPLIASSSAPSTAAENVPVGIFGSVSATDIIQQIKELLSNEPELARLQLEPQHIQFLGLEEGLDRLKALGRWEVEIAVNNLVPGGNNGEPLEPIRKMVEVLPGE